MDKVSTLRRYGLFDARVPRYTSFPPANRFEMDAGARNQKDWLATLTVDQPVSVYIHIPFCRRLCWFCACRTQGTKSLAPVEGYVADLLTEIQKTRALLPEGLRMERLHLGGGTPTLLRAETMQRLIDCVTSAFSSTESFEFSVEIDPTEAATEVLDVLANNGLNRASIGVQDFNPKVQDAIGRRQSLEQTKSAIDYLRARGVGSLNVDLLYGLPHQTKSSLKATLEQVVELSPERVALYGYAHVPHVSKRQVMIPDTALPGVEDRYFLAEMAHHFLKDSGLDDFGIDHFAKASDGLAIAAYEGRLRRNFQGYTDDPCATLLGFGASAISRFAQGYSQNAVSTAAYRERVQADGLAAHKGYALTEKDIYLSELIDAVMCYGRIDLARTRLRFDTFARDTEALARDLMDTFPDLLARDADQIFIRPGFGAAARIIAAHLDQTLTEKDHFSLAI